MSTIAKVVRVRVESRAKTRYFVRMRQVGRREAVAYQFRKRPSASPSCGCLDPVLGGSVRVPGGRVHVLSGAVRVHHVTPSLSKHIVMHVRLISAREPQDPILLDAGAAGRPGIARDLCEMGITHQRPPESSAVPHQKGIKFGKQRAQVHDPQSHAAVATGAVDQDERLAFAGPEYTRVVEARDIWECFPRAVALLGRCGRDVELDCGGSAAHSTAGA